MLEPFTYRAKVLDVYDGDTIRVEIDLGFGLKWLGDGKGVQIRFFGINAPEVKGEDKSIGLESKKWLKDKIQGKNIILKTIKDSTEKYGRYLGIIILDDGTNINELMVNEGYAQSKNY